MTRPARVVKLGGSLLARPDLVPRLREWLAGQSPLANILIVGGGSIVDGLRDLDQHHALGHVAAHWLSIRAMSITAAVVAELMPEARRVASLAELQTTSEAGVQIFEVEAFLRADQRQSDALPCGWEVTSDSIAALVARRIEAVELVLLKSALPERSITPAALAESGYVDQHFPLASRGLAVRCVDLREQGFPQIVVDALDADDP